MKQDRFEELIQEAQQEYHPPPEVPREAIWAGIQRRRKEPRVTIRRTIPGSRWIWWPAAAAAILVLGILIGRAWMPSPPGVVLPVAEVEQEIRDEAVASALYRVAARRHLSQVDAILTYFKAGSSRGDLNGKMGSWAAELLMETRLLMDSPAAEDEGMGRLLGDLELTLAQIVQISDERRGVDQEWITEGLEKKNILGRVRSWEPPRGMSPDV